MIDTENFMSTEDYEIALIVDNREKRNATDLNYFFDKLRANNIASELRSLPLGDFVWVIRMRNDANKLLTAREEASMKATRSNKLDKKDFSEYVLDFIIERKTADDLAASIMDGRYEEQKFRLKNCGINNVIYLIEGTPS